MQCLHKQIVKTIADTWLFFQNLLYYNQIGGFQWQKEKTKEARKIRKNRKKALKKKEKKKKIKTLKMCK